MSIWYNRDTDLMGVGKFPHKCDRCGTSEAKFYSKDDDGNLICHDCEEKEHAAKYPPLKIVK